MSLLHFLENLEDHCQHDFKIYLKVGATIIINSEILKSLSYIIRSITAISVVDKTSSNIKRCVNFNFNEHRNTVLWLITSLTPNSAS